jgi:hypothetical protein
VLHLKILSSIRINPFLQQLMNSQESGLLF